jgi:hypothetical protein
MATSSIFSNIHIDDEASCRSLFEAIESSKAAKKKETVMPEGFKELTTREEISELFKGKLPLK